MRNGAFGRELGQALRKLRRHDGHGGFGFEQQRHAALGHDAPADDENGSLRKVRKQG